MNPVWEGFQNQLRPSLRSRCPTQLADLLSTAKNPAYQHRLSEMVFQTNFEALVADNHEPCERLRLRAVSRPDAGKWLLALPNKRLHLDFESHELKLILKWWLGASILHHQLPFPARLALPSAR